VGSLPEGTVILLSTVQRDVTGQRFFTSQLAQLLAPSASVPVYVLGGWALGSGAVGGAVVDSDELGARAGRLAMRVLGNINPESVPIEVVTKGTPMVDWRALRRWGSRKVVCRPTVRSATGHIPCGGTQKFDSAFAGCLLGAGKLQLPACWRSGHNVARPRRKS